jgi:hypothetical protein
MIMTTLTKRIETTAGSTTIFPDHESEFDLIFTSPGVTLGRQFDDARKTGLAI